MAKATELSLGLTRDEIEFARRTLRREPNYVEWAIIEAEWSEHCSYKSSKSALRLFPTKGPRVLVGPGYDAGVIDVGDGYVVSLHIESHNHPSAVDPYGGAATGIGGVLRDILSVGTRPIALVDVLRFGKIDESAQSQWLFRNVVRGIADYGNCVGVPTVSGEVEFDESFEKNPLVDVACIGLGKKADLILGEANVPGDVLVLVGGSTGRDGIGGASFASRNLAGHSEERSAVQVPDPFMKKLLLDAMLEAIEARAIRGMKDLGGGGLTSALSELASKGNTGVDVELARVAVRESDMGPAEIMVSESQERMMLALDPKKVPAVLRILKKYEVPSSIIGKVTQDGYLTARFHGNVVAHLPASFIADAPEIPRASRPPVRRGKVQVSRRTHAESSKALLGLLASPNIGSRRWIYQQYDHEVGVRTVVKPGGGDAALLRLPGGKMLAVKGDGNSSACSLDPYSGAAGCVAEACRNVVAVGARPAALVDHLQFGDPGDPEVYWSFKEAVRGMADYCKAVGLPVVGGKVSFYNQDALTGLPIKSSPIALVVGLADGGLRASMGFSSPGETVVAIGKTREELGGSEYLRRMLEQGGKLPSVDPVSDKATNELVLRLIGDGLVSAVHDCSKGGVAVALAEMCISSGLGAAVDIGRLPAGRMKADALLFSESHGRFIVSTRAFEKAARVLERSKVPYAAIGKTGGRKLSITKGSTKLLSLSTKAMENAWESGIPRSMGESK